MICTKSQSLWFCRLPTWQQQQNHPFDRLFNITKIVTILQSNIGNPFFYLSLCKPNKYFLIAQNRWERSEERKARKKRFDYLILIQFNGNKAYFPYTKHYCTKQYLGIDQHHSRFAVHRHVKKGMKNKWKEVNAMFVRFFFSPMSFMTKRLVLTMATYLPRKEFVALEST